MSESVHADLTTVNNKVNLDKNNQHGSNNIDRPLPPIPKDSSLEKVEEHNVDDENGNIGGDKQERGTNKDIYNGETSDSDNDDDEIDDDDNDDDDDGDDGSEIEAVPDSESDMENDLTTRGFNPNNELPPIPNSEKSDIIANGSASNDLENSTSSLENDL